MGQDVVEPNVGRYLKGTLSCLFEETVFVFTFAGAQYDKLDVFQYLVKDMSYKIQTFCETSRETMLITGMLGSFFSPKLSCRRSLFSSFLSKVFPS